LHSSLENTDDEQCQGEVNNLPTILPTKLISSVILLV